MKNFVETIIEHRSILECNWENVYGIKGMENRLKYYTRKQLEHDIYYILDLYEW